jgi:hypothetical protein
MLNEDREYMMRQKVRVKEKTENHVASEQCHHYWIIEMANGPKSRGVCRYCGEARDFFNSMPDFSVLKRNSNPLGLPKMPDVKLDEDSKS